MIYTFVDTALWYLQRDDWDLGSCLEDQVLTLAKELRFTRTYLIYMSMSKGVPSGSSNSIINSFETAFINSTKDLSSAFCGSLDAVGPVVCYMLEKVKECKQEIRKAYAIFWNQPWESNTPPIIHAVMEFVESVLKNLNDLLATKCLVPFMKENIESLEEKLRFIQKLIGKIEKGNVVHRKMGAFLIYVQLIKPCTSDRVDIYIELLKAPKSKERKSGDTMMDEVEGFVDFLLGNSAACIKDRISTIRGELVYLIKFLMELPDHCAEDLGQISADIKRVVKGVGLLHIKKVKDDRVQEMTLWLSTLLQKMNLIKEKISGILLQSCEESVTVPMKQETVAIHEGLEFQRMFSADLPGEKKKDHKVTLLTYSIHGKKLTEDMVRIVNYTLFALLKEIDIIRVDMYAREQQSHRADLVSSLKDQIQSLQEDIKGIESDFKGGKLCLADTEYVAPESSSLSPSFHAKKALDSSEDRVNEVNISVFELTDIIKAELFLMELRIDEVGLMFHMKDQAEKLQEGLRFLRSFLMKPPRKYNQEKELMLKKTEALAIEASSAIFSFYENAMKESVAMEMNLVVSELLEKIDLLKMEITKVYLQVPLSLHSNLPDGLVFLSSLLGDVWNLLNYKGHSVDFVKPQIEMLYAELESLKFFLVGTAKQHNEHEELKDLWTCIADIAYETEYMIDSSVFGDDPEWYFVLWLPIALKKIKLIKLRIIEIYDKSMPDIGIHNEKTLSHEPSRDYNLAVGEVVIGLDVEADFMFDLLIKRSLRLDIVSIVGPPGLGKTTLAKKVYYNPACAYHFNVQAWFSATPEYRRRELLYDILSCVVEVNEHDRIADDDELAMKLYQCLKGVRYLIVIDNLQQAEAWDDLRILLPDDHTGSRVLITSQFRHLALHANPYSEPYPLRLLSTEEGWMLLQEKIFPRAISPPELLEVGKQISAKCKGIPLVLVLMAGILARTDKTLSCWKQMAKSSRADSFMDLLDDVFELCYRHLPDPLKSCLLYFGAFPVNKEILVSKLFRLWISEGFLPKNELKGVEDLVKEFLADLIGRNLVTIAQRSSINGIKTCRVHDLLWNFCTKKANKENFLQLTSWSHLSNPSAFEERRICLCIGAGGKQFIMSRTPCVRCLLCSVSGDMNQVLHLDVDFISNNFKLLRVLDLECINIGNSFPAGLLLLELLRYLAVKGGINSVPDSLANLWNLETLIVKGSRGEVALPNSFWKMQKLRHMHILPRFTFNWQDDENDYSVVVPNYLLSLSTPVILNGYSSMANAMKRFCTLRKLKCILDPSWDSIIESFNFPAFDFLFQLESLKISAPTRQNYFPYDFSFPANLRKLTLSGFVLAWGETAQIRMLPNLETLKLLYCCFKGKEWEVQEGDFCRLKYLKLDSLDIVRWVASYESFRCLERLVIHRCRQLEEIPFCLGEIPTLQMMEVQSCSRIAVVSARQILEEQLDMGNEDLKVIVDDRKRRI